MNKEKKGISPAKYGFYLYVLRGDIARYIGLAGILSTTNGTTRLLSEFAGPPFGYVLELNPGQRREYCDITFFANEFGYNEKKTITLNIPVYEANTHFPADYRTKREVMRQYIENKLEAMDMGRQR